MASLTTPSGVKALPATRTPSGRGVRVTIDTPGYCYLVLFRRSRRAEAFALLGAYPLARDVMFHQPLFHPQWWSHKISEGADGVFHVHKEGGSKRHQHHYRRQRWLVTGRFALGAQNQAPLGRTLVRSAAQYLMQQFNSMDGPLSIQTLDNFEAGAVNRMGNALAGLPVVAVPANLSSTAQMDLFTLFGRYQLDPSAPASGHACDDSFRRVCDRWVYDTHVADDVLEIGPNLGRLAAQPTQFPGHSCSPELDGRDRARALLSSHRIPVNHPRQQVLHERARGNYVDPVVMCSNPAHLCAEQKPVIFASYSLQDQTPAYLVDCMRAHGSSIAYVSLNLPMPLLYVNSFFAAETSERWERRGDKAVCFPGVGTAGYTHDIKHLASWLDLSNVPLFGEVLYQYGCSFLFRFTLNSATGGAESYPMLVETTLHKYALISGSVGAQSDFLTTATHYERLLQYLTIHHEKFKGNLFKAALERISTLTPAIVLGQTTHTDRWNLTANERIDVAIAACKDVQRTLHRATVAQELLNADNTAMAADARRALKAHEPSLFERFANACRGVESVTSSYGVGDYVADFLDNGRSASNLFVNGALPRLHEIANGIKGEALPEPNLPQRREHVPPAPVQGGGPRFRHVRGQYPGPQPWHAIEDQRDYDALAQLPVARDARLIAVHDPQANLNAAHNGLAAAPIDQLSAVQGRALANASWSPDTRLDVLVLGPPGTGKSTTLRRIAPEGTVVIVPLNELATAWRAHGYITYTLDQAVANAHELRTAAAIIIDEVYLFPLVYVQTICSLGIRVMATGCPAQRTYRGPLGLGYAHDLIPTDHVYVLHEIRRNGLDVTRIMNRFALPIYRQLQLMGPNNDFVTAQPGVRNIQRAFADRPGMHLTCHRVNTVLVNGCITVATCQGLEADDVYLHLFNGDEIYYQQNPADLLLAISRCRQTLTITGPPQPGAALRGLATRYGLNVVPRRANMVYGSLDDERFDAIYHPSGDRDPIGGKVEEFEQDVYTSVIDLNDYTGPSTLELVHDEMPADVTEALAILHPDRPDRTVYTETEVRMRAPDHRLKGVFPEFTAQFEPMPSSVFHPVGYAFTNHDIVQSIYAMFDRYLKPQNVRKITRARAEQLAQIMFDRWCDAFIDPNKRVSVPPIAELTQVWLSARSAKAIADIAASQTHADTAGLLTAEYFLKTQGKPKFGAYGHEMECGQGILATDKLINLDACAILSAMVKVMQGLFKSGRIYDSGYSAAELDEAVAPFLPAGLPVKSLSADLTQQDSSHMIVHRLFIGMVLKMLGGTDHLISLYLISRERRKVRGMAIDAMFEVIERLFSGEPGTAFFNLLMSTGTLACTHELSSVRLIVGKGDDVSTVPPAKKATLAVNMLRETGVTQKLDVYPYFDFANRIWTTSLRSFPDPARLVGKYTCRTTDRTNSENEYTAFLDQQFTPDAQQSLDLAAALIYKRGLPFEAGMTLVQFGIALNAEENFFGYMRPSKIPADRLPTKRRCCGLEVVHENPDDDCVVAALAFIADLDIGKVREYLADIRRVHGTPDEVIDRNAASPFAQAEFVGHEELKMLAAKCGVRLNRSTHGLALHLCRGHVSVVRAAAPRHQASEVYGSLRQTAFSTFAWLFFGTFCAAASLWLVIHAFARMCTWLRKPPPASKCPVPVNVLHHSTSRNVTRRDRVFGSLGYRSIEVTASAAKRPILYFLSTVVVFALVDVVVFALRPRNIEYIDHLYAFFTATWRTEMLDNLRTLVAYSALLFSYTFMGVYACAQPAWMLVLSACDYAVYLSVPVDLLLRLSRVYLDLVPWAIYPFLAVVFLLLAIIKYLLMLLTSHALAIITVWCIVRFTSIRVRAFIAARLAQLYRGLSSVGPRIKLCIFTVMAVQAILSLSERMPGPTSDYAKAKRAKGDQSRCDRAINHCSYTEAVKICHPDHGGTREGFERVRAMKRVMRRRKNTPAFCRPMTAQSGESTATPTPTSYHSSTTTTGTTTATTSAATWSSSTTTTGTTTTTMSTAARSTSTLSRSTHSSAYTQTEPTSTSSSTTRTSTSARPTVTADLVSCQEALRTENAKRAIIACHPDHGGTRELFEQAVSLRPLRQRHAQEVPDEEQDHTDWEAYKQETARMWADYYQKRFRRRRFNAIVDVLSITMPLVLLAAVGAALAIDQVREELWDAHDQPPAAAPAPVPLGRPPARLRPIGEQPPRVAPRGYLVWPPMRIQRIGHLGRMNAMQARIIAGVPGNRRPVQAFDILSPVGQAIFNRFTAPTQAMFGNILYNHPYMRYPDFVIHGIAGAAKSQMLIDLIPLLARPVHFICPTSELRDSMQLRVLASGLDVLCLTPHQVFGAVEHVTAIIDEIFLLPMHVSGRIAQCYDHCIAIGDMYQITDPGFLYPPDPYTGPINERLLTSWTVPQDVIEFSRRARIIDGNSQTRSQQQMSMYVLTAASPPVPRDYQAICFARDCTQGALTVHMAQGQRWPRVVLHACHREIGFTGPGMPGQLWTALSRHTEELVLDISQDVRDALEAMGGQRFLDF